MSKQLLLKTWRDLRAARSQALALVAVVALGIASYIALIGAYRDLATSYNRTYDQLSFADVTFAIAGAPESIVEEIASLEEVSAVTGRLVIDTGFELEDGQQIRSRLIGIPIDPRPEVNDVLVLNGRFLQPTDTRSILLQTRFAEIYELEPGDTVSPIINGQTMPFEVAGIAATPEYLIVSPSQQDIMPAPRTFAVLFVSRTMLQELVDATGTVNDISVRFQPDADNAAAISTIQEMLREYQLESTIRRSEQPSNAALQEDLVGYREIADLMPTLILLVAAFSVYIMLGRMVRAQQPQIGLMKALGYTNRAVLGHYLAFSLAIGLIGLLLGVILGIPLAGAITTAYAQELGIPLVETEIYGDLVVQSIALAVIVAIIAGIGPSRSAIQLTPAEAMRLDPAVALVDGRKTALENLVRLPMWLRLPLRTVFRMRRRSLTTGAGIVFAFILILMVLGFIDSMNQFVNRTFQDIELWEMNVVFDSPQSETIISQVRSWDGVMQVEPNMQMPVTLKANGHEEDVLLTAIAANDSLHALQLQEDSSPSQVLDNEQIVLTTGMADLMELQPGDELTVETPFGRYDLTVGGTSKELMSAAAYVSLETVQSLAGLPAPIFNGLYLTAEESQMSQLKDDLYHLPGAASVQVKDEFRRNFEELMGLFYAVMGVMLLFAIAMAAALIFNAMTVNVMERERELATMRAIGTGRRSIARQMAVENVVLWLITIIPGCLLGYWVAVQMGEAFSAELFTFEITIAPFSYALTALGILATMILASWPAVRRVNRLNLAEATKVLT